MVSYLRIVRILHGRYRWPCKLVFESLHPRKWRTRAPVLTGGPGAAPGDVASKNGWVYMRVQGGSISYSRFVCMSVCLPVITPPEVASTGPGF